MTSVERICELFTFSKSQEEVSAEVRKLIASGYSENDVSATWKSCLSFIDLTTLNGDDTEAKVQKMTAGVNYFNDHFFDIPNVASICVYPALVETVKRNLRANVNIASVAAGFPASQTFLDVKKLEVSECIQKGANEVDIVISVGKFLGGDYVTVYKEIEAIKEIVKPHHLKVILETGLLLQPALIYNASVVAMAAGADFIKTSTGKVAINATTEATYVMCQAIKDWYSRYGIRIGYKAAGGISTTKEAVEHYTIVKAILGENWLNKDLFRFGASRLANNLLSSIVGKEEKYF